MAICESIETDIRKAYSSFQNVQQSRSFSMSFKFPEGLGAPGDSSGSALGSGNMAFADNMQDDDLYNTNILWCLYYISPAWACSYIFVY